MLEISGLDVGFGLSPPVLAGIDLTIAAGETVALVGESGSGKSLMARSILRLLPRGAAVTNGSISFEGEDVLSMPDKRLNRLRGGEIAMLFQQPLTMLDPTATVGSQVAEAVTLHTGVAGAAARDRVVQLFREVGILAPETRAAAYPHQLSGGMAQRVMIAAALAGSPRLLIADEPTTALDVTVQLQILQLLARERTQRGLSTLLITHDLGVVSAVADRVLVLYAGRVIEQGTGQEILKNPQHPYTQALVRASLLQAEPDGTLYAIKGSLARETLATTGCRFLPRCSTSETRKLHEVCASHEPALVEHGASGQLVRCCSPGPPQIQTPMPVRHQPPARPLTRTSAVSLRGVSKHYTIGRKLVVRSLDHVDLDIHDGEALGLVGESGCGKSTLARILLRMERASAGAIHAVGHDFADMTGHDRRQLHRDTQLIFQDPVGALDPPDDAGREPGRPAGQQSHRHPDRAARDRDRDDARRGVGRVVLRPAATTMLRRAAPARRHRARAPDGAETPDLRRADLCPRRLDPRADPQPLARAAPQPRLDPADDHPRPPCRQTSLRSSGRHVSRRDRRNGGNRRAVHPSCASLHAGPDRRFPPR